MNRFIKPSDSLAVRGGLVHFVQDRDVRRLEYTERDDRHDAHHAERDDEPGVIGAGCRKVSGVASNLKTRGERHHDDGWHNDHHLGHEAGGELGTSRYRKSTEDRTNDQSDKEVDAGPQPAAHDVIEHQAPLPVEADRECDEQHRGANNGQRCQRHDLNLVARWRAWNDVARCCTVHVTPGRESTSADFPRHDSRMSWLTGLRSDWKER